MHYIFNLQSAYCGLYATISTFYIQALMQILLSLQKNIAIRLICPHGITVMQTLKYML